MPTLGPSSWGIWPAWSPNGSEIAFFEDEQLAVADAVTGATRKVVLPAPSP